MNIKIFEDWTIAIIAIIVSFFKAFDFFIKRYRINKSKTRLLSFINDSKSCDFLAKKIIEEDYADRVYIFKGHNSGGNPRLGTPYFVTPSFYYYKKKEFNNRGERYKNLEVDNYYKDLILNLLNSEDGSIEIIKDNLPENSILKNIYDLENIKYSVIFKLAITDKEFFYMSISWNSLPEKHKLLEAKLIANQITTIYKKHYKQ